MMSLSFPPSKRRAIKREESIAVLPTKGVQPHYKVKSSITVIEGGQLFLFGGFDEDDFLDSNVYLLDLESNEWTVHNHEVTREGHSCVYIGNQNVLVFGGVPDDSSNDNQLLIYNITDNKWIDPPQFTFVNQPSMRSRHATCLSEDGTKMYVSGGIFNSVPLDDLYCYNLVTGKWEGPMPFVCRFDHFITIYNNKIYSFGGLNKEMNHVKTKISWFDLSNGVLGEISIINPENLSGDHIYLDSINDSTKLDVSIPIWNSQHEGIQLCISSFDLVNLAWQNLLTGDFDPLSSHRWKHTFIYEDYIYLLGYPLTAENALDVTSFDYKLSNISRINLSSLGILKTTLGESSFSSSSLAMDMRRMFVEGDWTDFEIIALNINERINIDSLSNEEQKQLGTLRVSLKVHKAILLARWPHFRRMMSSGMNETVTGKMYVPEPVAWVKGLIQHLYTDSIDPFSIVEYSGILILANLYELTNLRKQVLHRIYKALNSIRVDQVLKMWSNCVIADEFYLIHRLNQIISLNWAEIVRSEEFMNLPKESIVRICQECHMNLIGSSSEQSASNEAYSTTDDNSMREQTPEDQNECASRSFTTEGTADDHIQRENSNSPFLLHPPSISSNDRAIETETPSVACINLQHIQSTTSLDSVPLSREMSLGAAFRTHTNQGTPPR